MQKTGLSSFVRGGGGVAPWFLAGSYNYERLPLHLGILDEGLGSVDEGTLESKPEGAFDRQIYGILRTCYTRVLAYMLQIIGADGEYIISWTILVNWLTIMGKSLGYEWESNLGKCLRELFTSFEGVQAHAGVCMFSNH